MSDVAVGGEVVAKAAIADVALLSDDELLAAATGLERCRAMLEAVGAHVVGELAVREVCDREFGCNTTTWVAHETGGDRAAIGVRVQVAAKLRYPLIEVDAALS